MGALPLTVVAQDDDLYFTPKKSSDTEIAARHMHGAYDRPTYYCGSNRDIDEYNRRGKLKSYYQKIGTDSLGNDIIEFHEAGATCGAAATDSTTTIYPGSERYYDDGQDDDFAYSRRMGRFDGFYGYWDPAFYGTYWASPYWHGYYGWYDPWYDPWYGPYYSGWYGGWYNPWRYGYYGMGWPYFGWGGSWYAPTWSYARRGPAGTLNHANGGGRFYGNRTSTGQSRNGDTTSRWFGNRSNNNGFDNRNDNAFRSRNNSRLNSSQYQQPRQTYSNPNSGFGSSRGSFGGGAGFGGGTRGGFGGGSRGGFGSRR